MEKGKLKAKKPTKELFKISEEKESDSDQVSESGRSRSSKSEISSKNDKI